MGAKQFAMVNADGTIHRHPPRDNQLTGDVMIANGTNESIMWLRGYRFCDDKVWVVEVYKGTDHWYPVYDTLTFEGHSWPM